MLARKIRRIDRGGIAAAGDRHDARSHGPGAAARRPGSTESGSATQFPLASAEVVVLQALGDCNMVNKPITRSSLAWAQACK